MNSNLIILNQYFEINPNRNLVTNRVTGQEIKLEARLMKLLCLLLENKGQLVKREIITKEIWDDYGNADESLTQGISYLRKILKDDQKKLIETVPKKGYVLHTNFDELITDDQKLTQIIQIPKSTSKRFIAGVVITMLVLAVSLFLLFKPSKKELKLSPDVNLGSEKINTSQDDSPSSRGKSADVLFIDSVNDPDTDSFKR